MQKIKKLWEKTATKLVLAALILATATSYFPGKATAATSLESVKDTISNSNVSQANVTHVITASTSLAVDAGGYLEISFPANFTNLSAPNISCPNGGSNSLVGNSAICTYASGVEATSSVITITGVTNPSAIGSYGLYIYNRQLDNTIKEQSSFRVAIVNGVLVTASVESTLTFTISGLATSSLINGIATTGSSTYNTLAFGVLAPGVKKTLGQRINVGTNATYGFTVTVSQDHNLVSSGGADIDAFKDGVAATTTAAAWAAPSGILGSEATYGHFGLSSEDGTLSDGDAYGASLYKGLKNSDPVEIMYNGGPSNGTSEDIGSTTVAYSIEVNPLQESGDYSNTLTYVCTPTY